jgi:hypothetical protein
MVQLGVEQHLPPPHEVAIQVAYLAGQGIEGANGAPLLIGASARRHRRLQNPSGGDFRPTPIAKLIHEQRYHRISVAHSLAQTTVQPPHLPR